ncbi:gamma-aminobutyric acid type B receptor subunit 2-like [Solea solea]|uniref:gamma-aminobutyric acid type B receptor subunit 2-like n=1 Tax=Solea solea TaxID=90069 RepID=UPI00272D848D|nr:gamma-aminobutyric acid type B receptor subunit 2-like [Solea solea]
MCGRLLLLLLVLVLVLAHGLAVDLLQAQVRHPLPVLWMMPVDSGSGSQNLTAGVGSAIRMALQDLKKQPAPLGNYEIQLHLVDSQCDPAKSLKALFDTMWEGPKYLLVFGGVCPSVTTIITHALPALNLVQVSFADTSPSLANRKWYRNLFSLMPSDRVVNQAAVKLLQRYQWARVGVVTQETPRLSQMKTDLLRQLLKTDVHAVSTQSLSNDVCSSLRRLKDHDVHIVIAHVEEDLVSELFCCVYRLNLFGPQYQWIVFDSGTAGWRLGWRASACELNSLAMAADGSIRLQITALANANTPGVSGRTPQNFLDSYLGQLVQEGSEVSSLHAFAYDSVWVAATALGHVMEAVKRRQKYGIQRNVTVSGEEEEEEEEEEEQRMLLDAIKRTRFDGVTGEVRFRNGERMSTIELIQFQDSSGVLVGLFSTVTEQLHLHDHLLKFKGVTPATDHTLVRLQRLHVTVLLYCIVSSAAAVTVFITLLVLCFVIISGRLWLLGSSSRTQDVLLLLGLLLSSSSVVLSGLDGVSVSEWTFELLCSVRLWTLSVGHTVVFAVLLSKTWTLYFLHRVKQKQQQSCRVLLWIFLLDAFVLTCWQILDPLRRVELQHRSQSDSADPGVLTQPFSEHCSSTNMELWLTAVCGYKGPLLGLGCFLAWNIRSVETNRPGVSGRRLTPSVFAVAAFSASGATASLLTTHNPPLQFCVSSGLILSCNVFILTSMFAPTILNVWMNRGGDDDDDGGGGGGQQQDEAASEEGDKQSSRLNTQLKSRNAQLNVEIESVTTQLCKATEARTKNGEVRSVSWSDEARVSDDGNSRRKRSSPDDVNSPENVQRRLSVQLPILHRSYLPVIGGVSSSSSGLSDLEPRYI